MSKVNQLPFIRTLTKRSTGKTLHRRGCYHQDSINRFRKYSNIMNPPRILNCISSTLNNEENFFLRNSALYCLEQQRNMSSHNKEDYETLFEHEDLQDDISHSNDEKQPKQSSSTSSSSSRKNTNNKKLANVIRVGLALLNQSAMYIRNNNHTRKNPFSNIGSNNNEQTARNKSEENRIFTVVQESLEEMCIRGDDSLMVPATDEPILILGVKVNKTISYADIYWTMPYSILVSKQLSNKQKEYLHSIMEERLITGEAGKKLRRIVYSVLSNYYPPKLRFKSAPTPMIQKLLHDFNED